MRMSIASFARTEALVAKLNWAKCAIVRSIFFKMIFSKFQFRILTYRNCTFVINTNGVATLPF